MKYVVWCSACLVLGAFLGIIIDSNISKKVCGYICCSIGVLYPIIWRKLEL